MVSARLSSCPVPHLAQAWGFQGRGSLTADSKITGGKPGAELQVQNISNLQITKPSS